MINLNFKNYYVIFLGLGISLFFAFNNFEKEATMSLLVLLVLIAFSYKFIFQTTEQIEYKLKNKRILGFTFLFLFCFSFISQNVFLNFETIDWDVASYLVASQDINNGNLPNQEQWESKGPFLFYLYNLISLFSFKNLVIFRLINDLIIFVISFVLYLSVLNLKKYDYTRAFFTSVFFLLLMSQGWAVSEYSETFSLLFLSISFYLITKLEINYKIIFFIGFLLSLSTLINQGTFLFVLPYVFFIFKNFKNKKLINIFQFFVLGLSLPHIFSLIIYASNGLLDIYLTTYVEIPLGYIKANYASFYELRVFLREFFDYIDDLFFTFISLSIFLLINLLNRSISFIKLFSDLKYLNILASLLFYFIGSHNYYHHLIFFLYFMTFLLVDLKFHTQTLFIYTFITISLFSFLQGNIQKSIYNLTNINKIYNEYPLKELSSEIDSYFDEEYSILALDYVLVLYYLEKENYTYIIHPTNHFEEFIVTTLSDIGKIEKDYISNILLNENPDVILCTQRMIIRGTPTTNPLYNCEVSDYRKDYIKLDTKKYETNPNLNYYLDPYKEVKVFIRKEN